MFKVCVKPVPLYHFKLAYVVRNTTVEEFSKPCSRNGEISRSNGSYEVVLVNFKIPLTHQI